MAKARSTVQATKHPAQPVRATHDSSLAPAAPSALAQEKEPLTIRLSRDLLSALYHHQADVRSAGRRKRETTIGAVIETLLREALDMATD